MDKPKFIIDSLLNNSIEDLKNILYKNEILCKDYDDDNLLLVYHKYNTSIKNDLTKECRSLVIDKLTKKIVSYSCETPNILTDNNNIQYYSNLLENSLYIDNFATECYEGPLLSIFYHNDKWYVSTRRCLDSNDSIYNEKSHYELFKDVILENKYNNIDEFFNKLEKDKSYYFVLLHYLNYNVINYSYKFGDLYKKLCLVSIRDNNLNEIDLNNLNNNIEFINTNIFISPLINNLNDLYYKNYNKYPNKEGIILKIWDNLSWKYNLIKFQYKNYQFHNAIGNNNNMFRGLIYLYQKNELTNYILYNPIFKKIDEYDTLDLINNSFKVLSSEILQLFKIICKNLSYNKLLPNEYKNIVYFFKINHNSENRLTLNYIYNYLKKIPFNVFFNLIINRKLLFLKNELTTISTYCHPISLDRINLLIDKINQ